MKNNTRLANISTDNTKRKKEKNEKKKKREKKREGNYTAPPFRRINKPAGQLRICTHKSEDPSDPKRS